MLLNPDSTIPRQENDVIIGNGSFKTDTKSNLARFEVTLLAARGSVLAARDLDTAFLAFFATGGSVLAAGGLATAGGSVLAARSLDTAIRTVLAAGGLATARCFRFTTTLAGFAATSRGYASYGEKSNSCHKHGNGKHRH